MSSRALNTLRRSNPAADQRSGSTRVLISLMVPAPDQELLQRLRGFGLEIDEVIKGTVIGTIDAARVGVLKADPAVRAVEASTRLTPHQR